MVGVLGSKVSSQWGVVAAIVTDIHDEGDDGLMLCKWQSQGHDCHNNSHDLVTVTATIKLQFRVCYCELFFAIS